MTKSLLITVISLFLTACGSKGDLYLPADKPVEQVESVNSETKSEQKADPSEAPIEQIETQIPPEKEPEQLIL